MADMTLYPEALRGLGLTFEEAIYAIAFGVEEEIKLQGKEAVFKELGMTQAEMIERVNDCLEAIYESYAYALRRVLGDIDSSEKDAEKLTWKGSLAECFDSGLRCLRGIEADGCLKTVRSCRSRLLKGCCDGNNGDTKQNTDEISELLYTQVQQLMNEVRYYDEKRDQALSRIEELMSKIQERRDCPAYFGKEQSEDLSQGIELDGPVTQILWSYRSRNILQQLNLTTVNEVVDYFQDFDNFADGDEITLLEWSVIVTVLRKVGLLAHKTYEILKPSDKLESLELSTRAYNGLRHAQIHDVKEILSLFADGAAEGWGYIRRRRGMGAKSRMEIAQKLSETTIELDEMICFPMEGSDVLALDFTRSDQIKLLHYGLETVGRLLEACRDKNRFCGLRYMDEKLYRVAQVQLKKYGCLV